MALGLDHLYFARHLDHGTFFFHGAVSFSFGRRNINHVTLLFLVAVRFLNIIGNFDGVTSGLLVTIGFGFEIFNLDGDAFLFAFINIDGFGAWNLDLDAFLDLLTVRLLDSVRYINKSAVGNLYINANSLRAGNLGGNLSGNIFANCFWDFFADRPLSPAFFLFRRARMAFIDFNGFANLFNLGFYFVFIYSSFMTFLFSNSGALFFFLVLGDISEMLFTFHVAFRLKLEVWDILGDFFTDILTLLLRPQERDLAGF